MKLRRLTTTLLFGALLATGCGGDGTETGDKKNPNNTDNQMTDAGADASSPNNVNNTNNVNNGSDAGPDTGIDAGEDMGVNFGRTLADYRTCFSDADCPVGLGTCVTEVPLNRSESGGRDRVALQEIFPTLESNQGVCTSLCTVNAAACDALSVNGSTPDAEPYVCQLIYAGESPYPDNPPAFPFDTELNPQDLASGVPFGAICRPPFQLDEDVDRGFCAPCVGGEACGGSSICWDFGTDAEAADGAPGECLGGCDAGACPSGFSCDAIGTGNFCVPIVETCSVCLDLDHDGRGVGRCGAVDAPVTPVDCDDLNPDAYYDPLAPGHAFPTHCAPENDYNCNGLSDAEEQIGSPQWGDDHCTTCGDTCSDAVLNGTLSCVVGVCTAICENTHASCDDDARNGCEQPVTDTSRIYYMDGDNDLFGDPNVPQFACDPNTPPMGFVSDNTDCNDMNVDAYPGGNEVCDGVDNDCNTLVDDGVSYSPSGSIDCTASAQGICEFGSARCDGMNGWVCDPAMPQTETCNGADDNCDGQIDLTNGVAPTEAPLWYIDCDNDGFGSPGSSLKRCSQPTSQPTNCPTGTWSPQNTDCDDTDPSIYPGRSEDCATAADDNCLANDPQNLWVNATSYYYDPDGDTYSDAPNTQQLGCGAPPASGWTPAVQTLVDCAPTNATVNPGATETCTTTFDDDCAGGLHNATSGLQTRYTDVDNDGYGRNATARNFCFSSMTTSERDTYSTGAGGDCNDSTTTRTVSSNGHQSTGSDQTPNKSEVCEGYDNNCDGTIDDGCPLDFSIQNVRNHISSIGSGSGATNFDCPANKVMVGMHVYGKIHLGFCGGEAGVFGIKPICADPNISTNTNNDPFTYSTSNSSTTTEAIAGYAPSPDSGCGNDTVPSAAISCNSNQSMRGIYGRSGARIDRIGPICVERGLNYSINPATLTLSTTSDGSVHPSQWNGGGDIRQECANNEVAKGFRGYFTGSRLTALRLRCVDMSLDTK